MLNTNRNFVLQSNRADCWHIFDVLTVVEENT